MEHGTALCDKIGKYEFLAAENLPSIVEVFDEPINLALKFKSHGILSRKKGNMDILPQERLGGGGLESAHRLVRPSAVLKW